MFICPVIQTLVISQHNVHISSIFRIHIDTGHMLFKRMRSAACRRNLILGLVQTRQQHNQKSQIIAERSLPGNSVFMFEFTTEPTIIGSIDIEFPEFDLGFIDYNISKHTDSPVSGMLDKIITTLGTVNHDLAFSTRNTDFLAAFGAAVNVISPALGQIVTKILEKSDKFSTISHIHFILMITLGNVPGKKSEIAVNQQNNR